MQVVSEGSGSMARDVIYGVWVIGADYRNRSDYYGSYPAGYMDRVMALFPDVLRRSEEMCDSPGVRWPMLHAFAGSIPPGRYDRLSLRYAPGVPQGVVGNVYDAAMLLDVCDVLAGSGRFREGYDLVVADPPYSSEDAKEYGTPMVDRKRATRCLAAVVKTGGFMAWLDTTWPMHRKSEWRTVGRIMVVRSTNHRVRKLTLLERIQAPSSVL